MFKTFTPIFIFVLTELTADWQSSILSPFSTILVEPSCEACLTEEGDVCLTVGSDSQCAIGTQLNTVQLSIFSHRFMSIAGGTTHLKK